MKKFKRFTIIVTFNIGVTVIGLPDFWENYFYYDYQYTEQSKSKYVR